MDLRNLLHRADVRRIAARAALEFVLCVAVVFFVGCIVWHKVDDHLNEALEQLVARQINTLAHSVGRQFHQQLQEMQYGAWLVGHQRLSPTELVNAFNMRDIEHKITVGIRAMDGELLAGELPPGQKDDELEKQLFDGKTAIDYWENRGLMFAAPIFDENEEHVVGVFYKLYDNEAMLDQFNLLSYDGEGSVILFDKTGPLGALTRGRDTSIAIRSFCEQLEIKEIFQNVWDTVQEQGSGARSVKYKKEHYFVFGAKVPDTEFLVIGYVPWGAVAGSIHYIYYVMLIAFGVLLCGIIMFARYVFVARLRARESEALKEATVHAEAANQAKSEFLSNMSHEIRTPINAVLGMDEMILRESKEPGILEYAQNIRVAGNNLLGLVNDILDFSKIEAGKMDIIPVEYALSSVLNDLVNMIQKRAEKKGLELVVKASPDLPSMLYGDEIRIKQVVTNILTNAVKYTEKGSVTLSVDYERQEGDSVLLKVSVKDTGIGIKESDIAKLFHAFERIEEERNRAIEGTGLGMNITQRLLGLMGSRLEVASVYGEGSTFSFRLAQKVMNWEPMGDFEESHRNSLLRHKEYRESFRAPDARILVVDDTVMNLTVIKGLLKQTKVQIDTAESGYECLKLAGSKKYDIIFLDHRMPGLDGIETLQRMRAMEGNPNADTPVISLTANAISGARESYIQAGFHDYLTKPINSAHLEAMMLKYLPAEKVSMEDGTAAEAEDDREATLPEWLARTDCLDARAGVTHCGSVEAYMDALTVFAESVETGADEIEKFFHAKDWKNYTVKVHALKSTARVIGAAELSEKARRLEDAGVSGYLEEISQDTPGLLALYRTYAEKLAPLFHEETGDAQKPPIDPSELADAYDTLRDVAASFDYDNLKFVLDSLAEYRLPEEEQARYQALRRAASVPDWDKVRELLENGGQIP